MQSAICGSQKGNTVRRDGDNQRKCVTSFLKADRGGFSGGQRSDRHRKSAPAPPARRFQRGESRVARGIRTHGFTLIEVLVALTILAIALAAASRAARVATDSAQETRLRTLATWVAQNRIAELTATNAFPGVGNVNGNSAMAGAEFSWQQATSTTPNAAFRRVELTVLQPGDTRYLVKLNAYLVRPPGKSS